MNPIGNKLRSRRRTDYEMRSPDDITSLVPCLAVKGTNLMISRGLDRWSKWAKCLFFTVAIHHHEPNRGGPDRAVRQKATSPDRCLTSVVYRKSQWLDTFTIIRYLTKSNFSQCISTQCNKVVSFNRVRMSVVTCSGGGETDLRRNGGGPG